MMPAYRPNSNSLLSDLATAPANTPQRVRRSAATSSHQPPRSLGWLGARTGGIELGGHNIRKAGVVDGTMDQRREDAQGGERPPEPCLPGNSCDRMSKSGVKDLVSSHTRFWRGEGGDGREAPLSSGQGRDAHKLECRGLVATGDRGSISWLNLQNDETGRNLKLSNASRALRWPRCRPSWSAHPSEGRRSSRAGS